ncbi:hypothetical protein CRM22_001370 [Opisthorchis felineus]|uniref:Protein-serine O-palmitoleoyltransferase porcupine n=1 Tax=Opisthorchis felineus TaxID=147828 RepID=A0A4S2MHA7_OPIFE|nr:hypothetical protein CRM22_001370 [Opisthorchis felineus]
MTEEDNPLSLTLETMDLSSWDESLLTEMERELLSFESYWSSLLGELVSCCHSVLLQIVWKVAIILSLCLLCRVTHMLSYACFKWQGRSHLVLAILNQFLEILSGLFLLHCFYDEQYSVVLSLVGSLGLLFALNPLHGTVLPVLTVCVGVLSYCEFAVDPEKWHQERGSVMIVIMKAISFSFDLKEPAEGHLSEPASDKCRLTSTFAAYRLISWLAYSLCPASLIFGPWFSFFRHQQRLFQKPSHEPSCWYSVRLLLRSFAHVLSALTCALFSLLWSTCLSSLVLSQLDNETFYYKWLNAYLASQSFRFSNYFVSYSSEAFLAALGIGYINMDSTTELTGPTSSSRTSSNGPIHVTHMLFIEFPRSLVDVVVNWNLPMHSWLKQHVYKPIRVYGHVQAILTTYAASSLLHGLNFQLSAVLLSIGMFAYIEFVLREKLSAHWNACVASRSCGLNCGHANKNQLWVQLCNLGFSCLSAFQLAYLAVMFDSSEQQAQGYSMRHVLAKWSELGFVGHYVALAAYLFTQCLQ